MTQRARAGCATTSMPAMLDGASGGNGAGGGNGDGGGLAGAVGAEQAVDQSSGDVEVDAIDRRHRILAAVDLAQP